MIDETDLQFIDTNILVYAHDKYAGEKYERAEKLIEALWESGNGCISIQVLQEFYTTVTTKIKNPLKSEIATEIISAISTWRVYSPEAKDVLRAIDIQRKNQIAFWDAMIIFSAARLGCRVIWSEDLNDGQVYEGVKVSNPFN